VPSPSIYLTLYTGIFLLSVNGLFAKGIPLDATSITQLRSVVAALVISAYLILLKKGLSIPNKNKRIGVYFLGLLMGLHWVTFFHSMQVSTVATGMLSIYTYPIITVLMESTFHRKLPEKKDILSCFLVLIGIFLLTADGLSSKDSSIYEGVFWGVVSAFLFASRNVIQKYGFKEVSSEHLMLHQVFIIALMLIAFTNFSAVSSLSPVSWLKIITLGIVTTAGAHTLLVLSYKHFAAKTVALSSCLQPVIGAFLAWVFLHEQPSIYIFVGGVIILGVAVYETLSSKEN
jgi:drug/metabolite transporter (DMT)-like permease